MAPRAAPGIVQILRYANGTGDAVELAYLWLNFEENGVQISSRFNSAERRLAYQIVMYWGAFVENGAPQTPGQSSWPPYTTTSPIQLSLDTNDRSRLLGAQTVSAEHHCPFWNELAGI